MKNTLLVAAVGEAAIAVADKITLPSAEEIQAIGQLVLQIIVAVATIWKMFKKEKPKQ
jgi:hypothetical protein